MDFFKMIFIVLKKIIILLWEIIILTQRTPDIGVSYRKKILPGKQQGCYGHGLAGALVGTGY